MRRMINSDPLDFEGLIHNQKMQRAAAQLPSGQNKKRPPLTMEPSTDDPLAATTVTPAKAGVQRENMDSRLRGNGNSHRAGDAANESAEQGGAAI
ncbi:MAG: hypothetical protein GQF41_0797 [Candidatus Rifleibacterium amylolyticum]|nr:MAG: hypothetical protein GQF41_0797 [Candidatus Rifleibacterium amylolyticum]